MDQIIIYTLLGWALQLWPAKNVLIGCMVLGAILGILSAFAPKNRVERLQVRGGKVEPGDRVIWLDAPLPEADNTIAATARTITWTETTTKTIEAPADSTIAKLDVGNCRRCWDHGELFSGFCLDCHLAGADAGYVLLGGIWILQQVQDDRQAAQHPDR